jgi:hypothetical protein
MELASLHHVVALGSDCRHHTITVHQQQQSLLKPWKPAELMLARLDSWSY